MQTAEGRMPGGAHGQEGTLAPELKLIPIDSRGRGSFTEHLISPTINLTSTIAYRMVGFL
jgi:hypothetical protein